MGVESGALASDRRIISTLTAGDSIRGIGLLFVFLFHAASQGARSSGASGLLAPAYGTAFYNLLQVAHTALYSFFVLSGYLISRPYVRAFVSASPRPSARQYYRNRALRVVPAMWFIWTLILARLLFLKAPGQPDTEVTRSWAASVYLFVQTYVVPQHKLGQIYQAWSLDVEVAFYILVPIVAFLVARAFVRTRGSDRRIAIVVTLAAVVAAASLAFRQLTVHTAFYTDFYQRSAPSNLFAFMPGVALAAVEARLIGPVRDWPFSPWLAVAMGVLGVVFALSLPYLGSPVGVSALSAGTAGMAGTLIVASSMVWQASGRPRWRVTDNAVTRWLGTRSYSFYLSHLAITSAVALFAKSSSPWVNLGLYVLIALPLTIAFAALSYRFVESPFLNLKKKAGSGSRGS